MKKTAVLLLGLLIPTSMLAQGSGTSGGDGLRDLARESKKIASKLVMKYSPGWHNDRYDDWLYRYKQALAADILESPHLFVEENADACVWTEKEKLRDQVFFSIPKCSSLEVQPLDVVASLIAQSMKHLNQEAMGAVVAQRVTESEQPNSQLEEATFFAGDLRSVGPHVYFTASWKASDNSATNFVFKEFQGIYDDLSNVLCRIQESLTGMYCSNGEAEGYPRSGHYLYPFRVSGSEASHIALSSLLLTSVSVGAEIDLKFRFNPNTMTYDVETIALD